MILPAQAIRKIKLIQPFYERSISNGMTYGLGPAGYDVRIAEDVTLWPVDLDNLVNNWFAKRFPRWFSHRPSFCRASTPERFDIPNDLTAKIEDKSSFARQGLSVFNTTAEPGWNGFLTLELKNEGEDVIYIPAGSPIAQICFHRLEEATELPYAGRYQGQEAGPVAAKLFSPSITQEK